ncbi:uncharacterized protein [Palaemon carinicauda]|uniref:uncharacterized protein n=1 Tax=Palaemon carinicauda TaxID=392227 RepID=UPI0035B5C89E
MAKLLKPSRLDTDPSSSNAAKEWKHWHRTFTNFIEESGDAAPDKLRALVNCVSSSVYELIEDCSTFESAIAKLDSVYVKLPNEIFARHVLATRRQQSGESIDEFLRELHKLSKDCNFQPVTAEQYRQELVRDAFINGIASVFIRQRLIENKSLNLETAHSQARTLDLAQRSADAYASPPVPHTAALVPERQAQPTGDQQQHPTQEGAEGSSPGGSAVAAAYLSKRKCYFCGNALHSTGRVSCPARNATCNKCGKTGHFAKVCKSKISGSITATLYNPTLLAITATYPNNLSHAATNITVNGHSLKALVDSCSSDSFIREEVAQRLNLTVVPASSAVSMASKSFNASSSGFVIADLVHLDQRYPCIQLGVLKDLCCDVILGYDFQKQHQSVSFQYERKRPSLKITGAKPVCLLATADIDEPSLFPNLPRQCKPIAVKSRRFSQDDQLFVKDQISHLLSEGIIEPSISPWRAQVVVVKDPLDRHKKRLCIDYSQTINQYTELARCLSPPKDRGYGGASQAEHDENVQNFLEVVQKRNFTLNEGKSVISVPTINVLGYCVWNNVIKPDPDRLRPLQELPPPTNMGSLRRAQGLFAYYAKWIPGFSDTIHPLVNTKTFPLSKPALAAFNSLKKQLMDVSLRAVDESLPFVVECDASEVAVSAVLNQGGRPVAFMSRTLQGSELHYPAVEKEATAIIEAVRKWSHFLVRRHFTLITDQRSVMFMLDSRKRTKNKEQQDTRVEVGADDVKRVCASCRICAQQKPKFHRPGKGVLIKATQPMERLSIDFKGPLPSTTSNKYILTVVDEYSRFPFVFPCPNMHSKTVIKCLESIFILCVIKPDPDRLRPLQELPPPTNMGSLRRAQGLFAYYAKWIPGFSDTIHPLVNTKTFPLSKPALAAFNSLKKQLMDVSLRAVDESLPFVVECDASEVAVSAVLNQGGRPVAFMSRTLQGSELHYPAVEKEATAIIEAVRKWSHFLVRRHFTLITDQRSVMFMLDSRKRTKNKEQQDTRVEVGADDVKRVCASCRICAQQKPKFHRPGKGVLIKATQPMERLSIDFKGPLPSTTSNKYILTVVDEYSCFPFVFPCPNMHSKTVIKCLESIFILCGMPSFIHSDQGASFMSQELKLYLSQKGVATSRTTPYHPMGNGQVERYNGIIWKSICLVLESRGLKTQHWEIVLPEVLHSVRSLLCTATNEIPHERFFRFQRRSSLGSTLPSWLLTPGPVLLRRHVRSSKHEPLTEEVQLMDANSMYANVKYPDGRESTVSTRDLAPSPAGATSPVHHVEPSGETESPDTTEVQDTQTHDNRDCHESSEPTEIRKSTRVSRPPDRYGWD